MFNLRKIDLKFVFCYISPCNVFRKLSITHLFSIKRKKNKNLRLYMIMEHILKLKKNIFGPLWAHPIFSNFFFYSSVISLWIQISFQMIIFNFNPRNGHYLYPPFFQNIGVKEEKMGHFLGQKIFICNFFFV